MAREANDMIAGIVRQRPDRFQGFATLPTPDPSEAARELERAVVDLRLDGAMLFGRTGRCNLDHSDFRPLLETAAALHAPLYIHPQTPPPAVRAAYYESLGAEVATSLATSGLGWHFESGIQVVRLILSGVLDELPDLRLIMAHWGEVVLFYLDRINLTSRPANLRRPVSDYFRTNVWVTSSGLFSQRYLRWAAEVIGVDRIMCATDYPFPPVEPQGNRRFLEASGLSREDQENIACATWERLRNGIRR